MTFFQGLEFVYREIWTFIRKAWLVAALLFIPFLTKFAFRFLRNDLTLWEIRSFDYAMNLLQSSIHVSVFYVFTRFIVFKGDIRKALQIDISACRTFGPFALAFVIFEVFIEFLTQSGWFLVSNLIDVTTLSIFALWAVSAPGGGSVVSPKSCIRIGFLELPWALAFWLVATLPVGIFWSVLNSISPGPEGLALTSWLDVGLFSLVDFTGNLVVFAVLNVIARRSGLHFAERTS